MNIDKLNIGLMFLSTSLALIVPLELFLGVYAVLGPLHYLTQINWMHRKDYFTQKKYDFILLVFLGIMVASPLSFLSERLKLHILLITFFGAGILAFIQRRKSRWTGLIVLSGLSYLFFEYFRLEGLKLFFNLFLLTLVHVFSFTGLFLFTGALKSRSRWGLMSFFIFLLCPLFLFIVPEVSEIASTVSAREIYSERNLGLISLNEALLINFFGFSSFPSHFDVENAVFFSTSGLKVMRFIAFAYTYHYLNWFSKTKIIGRKETSFLRMVVIFLGWLLSVSLYFYDYALGLMWLIFLSIAHVILEFPLNFRTLFDLHAELRKRKSLFV